MLASSDEQGDCPRSYESGCSNFVRKPLEFSGFAQTVAQLGIYWVAANQLACFVNLGSTATRRASAAMNQLGRSMVNLNLHGQVEDPMHTDELVPR